MSVLLGFLPILLVILVIVFAARKSGTEPPEDGRRCELCHYAFDGIDPAGPCPECGVPQAERRRQAAAKHAASADRLTAVWHILLWGTIVLIGMFVISGIR